MDSNRCSAVALAAVLLAFGGVGCGGGGGGSASDAGNGQEDSAPPADAGQTDAARGADATPDAPSDAPTESQADSETDAPVDAGTPVDCGSVAPVGKQIVASASALVLYGGGVTSDGYVFYDDTIAQIVYAVPVAGGTPSSLGGVTSQSGTFRLNGGKAALYLPAATNPATEVAPLSVWSAATGAKVISTNAFAEDSFYYEYDVSGDGSYVGYYESNGPTATLTVSAGDGTNPKTLVEDVDPFSNQYCSPMVEFVGDTLVAFYCLAPSDAGTDGGVGELTVTSFSPPDFAPVPIVTFPAPSANAPLGAPYPPDPNLTELFVSVPTGGLALYPIAGGAPTVIDAAGTGGGYTPSGAIVYSTTAGAVVLDPGPDGGAPQTVVKSGVGALLTLSADGNWLQTATQGNGQFFNIDLLSLAAGTLTTEWPSASAYPTGFTPDSKYETFETNFPANFGITSFDFEASPVAGGAPAKVFSGAGSLAFTTGSKIVAATHPNATTGSTDIDSFDLSNSTNSTLVSQADPNFFYVGSSNQIVYTWHCAPTSGSGVWTVSAP